MTDEVGQVWVTHYVDYDGGDDGWWESERDAVEGLKQRYGKPYVVEWSDERDKDGRLFLRGDFERVPNYSIKHTAFWEIRCEPILSCP